MNYQHLFQDLGSRQIRMALTGARGGFGRSLLAQCRAIPALQVTALCDLDVDGTRSLLAQLGFAADASTVCETAEAAQAAQASGRIALVADHRLLQALALDIVVEATGAPEISVVIAEQALRRGVHVAMVTKETDSVAGPYLNHLAQSLGLVYTTADGDQPSNLIGLVSWARLLGFDVVAAGKSSEYDFIYDPANRQVQYTDCTVPAPDLEALWPLGDDPAARMRQRSEALRGLPQSATPDYCEMNVVANSTGLLPACDALNYPLCRISELADVFIPVEDGGILTRSGVVDVFNCLRRVDEASFGGGVFVVVRCADPEIWEVLREKGHLVSRNGRYACIYLPYHLMGLETPLSLLSAVLHKRPSGAVDQASHAVMAACTTRAFAAGEVLHMGGHHHLIEGAVARLLPTGPHTAAIAPFYVAANKRLRVDVTPGTLITRDMLELDGSRLDAAWQESLAITKPVPQAA
ncbi:MAG: homoserine dehydrogenase [Acetobacteraceae bacterium]